MVTEATSLSCPSGYSKMDVCEIKSNEPRKELSDPYVFLSSDYTHFEMKMISLHMLHAIAHLVKLPWPFPHRIFSQQIQGKDWPKRSPHRVLLVRPGLKVHAPSSSLIHFRAGLYPERWTCVRALCSFAPPRQHWYDDLHPLSRSQLACSS